MKSPLTFLHLTNDPADAQRARQALTAEGFACRERTVEGRSEFISCLELGGFDLILSDYRLPGFDGLSALDLARKNYLDVPFIFLSDRLGAEHAVEAIKLGAADVVLGCNPAHLGAAVRRAMQVAQEEKRNRLARALLNQFKEAQAVPENTGTGLGISPGILKEAWSKTKAELNAESVELAQAFQQMRFHVQLLSAVQDAVVAIDRRMRIIFWNAAAEALYQVPAREAIDHRLGEVVRHRWTRSGDRKAAKESLRKTGAWKGQGIHIKRDGGQILVDLSVALIKEMGTRAGIMAVVRDVTQRAKNEEEQRTERTGLEARVEEQTAELARTNMMLQREIAAHTKDLEALRESQQRFTAFMDHLPGFAWMKDVQGRYLYLNKNLGQWPEYRRGWREKTDFDLWPPEIAAHYAANDQTVITRRLAVQTVEPYLTEGRQGHVLVHKFPIFDDTGAVVMVGGCGVDITDRCRAEQELAAVRERLAADLARVSQLHEVSTRFVRQETLPSLLHHILEAAITVTGADMGNLQLLDGQTGKLKIMVHRGFAQPFLDFFNEVHQGLAACGAALQRRERIIIEDVTCDPIFAGKPELNVLLEAGVRAVQSTPLFSRGARLLGVLSTHYRSPRRPEERELWLLDLLARQAADYIERTQAAELLKQLPGKILRAQEAERRRVARDLHDSVSQTLFLAKIRVHAVGAGLARGSPAMRRQLAEAHELIAKTLEEVRRIAHNLIPSELEDLGLAPAVHSLCGDWGRRTKLAVDLQCANVPRDLPDTVSLAAFRIIQEALNNIEKHAKATKVTVRLQAGAFELKVSVQDNGVGFDPTAGRAHESGIFQMGLTNMRDRATAVGGALVINSKRAQGTVVQARVPFQPAQMSEDIAHEIGDPKNY